MTSATAPFLSWLDANAERLALETYRIGPIETLLPGYFDYAVSLRVGDVVYSGRGQARSDALARAKAAGEAVERWLVDVNRRSGATVHGTSSGFAVHPTPIGAAAGARSEVEERDLYLCHVIAGLPFKPVLPATRARNRDLAHFSRRLGAQGVRVELGLLPSETSSAVIICAAFGAGFAHPFGVVIGFGAHRSVQAAISKSLLECWTGLVPVLYQHRDRPPETRSRRRFLRLAHPGPQEHGAFGLHADGARSLTPLFDGAKRLTVRSGPPPRLTFRTWPRLPEPFSECPLAGARCKSRDLQPLFFGRATGSVINRRRIQAFCDNRGIALPKLDSDAIHLLR